MYARATAFRLKPEAQHEVVTHLREIRAQMEALDGLIQAHAMWNDEDGHGQTVALFESKEAADASEPRWSAPSGRRSRPHAGGADGGRIRACREGRGLIRAGGGRPRRLRRSRAGRAGAL